MDLVALHDLVRAEVQQRAMTRQVALGKLSPTQRSAFRAMQRRLRRDRALGRALAAPSGSAIWL
ncbi:MAG TPA: hypothetical protein VGL99_18835 [Chloroflexota bacterium]|jgi:hypothetical protein